MNYYKIIDRMEIISFDIFGTLLLRNVKNTSDVFQICEKIYNSKYNDKINNYTEIRIRCQDKLTEKLDSRKEEISYDEIFDIMNQYFSKEKCNLLKKIELNVEMNICIQNKKIFDLYDYCIKSHKKIFITSDMYLPQKFVIKLLNNNGINIYDKLYLSSSTNRKKRTGSIFKYYKSNLKINREKFLHIGDDRFADYIIPNMLGLKSICIKPAYLKEDNLNYFINNQVEKYSNYYFKFGYKYLGPILYGFSKYLHKNISSHIYFFSRDGYLMQRAYKTIYPNSDVSYFYASRRALIVPTLCNCKNINEVIETLSFPKKFDLFFLMDKLGLNIDMCKNGLENSNLNGDYIIQYEDLFTNEKIRGFLNRIFPLIIKNSLKELKLLKKYLRQEKFDNNANIVDIGWNGNMQLALEKITNFNINGFYLGIYPTSKNIDKIKMNGFLFEKNYGYNSYIDISSMIYLFENFFLGFHGSVKKYSEKGGKIYPELYEYESFDENSKQIYSEIQNGAIQFIHDFKDSYLSNILEINSQIAMNNLHNLASKPDKIQVNKIGDLKYFDSSLNYIAKPDAFLKYAFNLKKIFADIGKSGWIVGFLKRLTGIGYIFYLLYNIRMKK